MKRRKNNRSSGVSEIYSMSAPLESQISNLRFERLRVQRRPVPTYLCASCQAKRTCPRSSLARMAFYLLRTMRALENLLAAQSGIRTPAHRGGTVAFALIDIAILHCLQLARSGAQGAGRPTIRMCQDFVEPWRLCEINCCMSAVAAAVAGPARESWVMACAGP